MRTVPLHGKKAAGRVALVDDADCELVARYHWYIKEPPDRVLHGGPYAQANFYRDGKKARILMHTLLTGWPRVDHRDRNGLNNQRSNLRPATASQNGANRQPVPGRASQYKGVGRSPGTLSWRARIRFQGKLIYLGSFYDEARAAKTYDAAARELFGEFARINFPDDPAA